jgi:hypothetical protein
LEEEGTMKAPEYAIASLADRAAGGTSLPADVDAELGLWREALDLLEPHDVAIPFARELAEAFPTREVRTRRDFDRVLSLVRVKIPARIVKGGTW